MGTKFNFTFPTPEFLLLIKQGMANKMAQGVVDSANIIKGGVLMRNTKAQNEVEMIGFITRGGGLYGGGGLLCCPCHTIEFMYLSY